MRILYERTLITMVVASGLTILLMSVMVFLNVILRNLDIASFSWVVELSEYGLTVSTFLAAPWVLKEGCHVSVDVLVKNMTGLKKEIQGRLISLVGLGISLILLGLFSYILYKSFSEGSFLIKTIVIPEYLILVFPVVSLFFICVEFSIRSFGAEA